MKLENESKVLDRKVGASGLRKRKKGISSDEPEGLVETDNRNTKVIDDPMEGKKLDWETVKGGGFGCDNVAVGEEGRRLLGVGMDKMGSKECLWTGWEKEGINTKKIIDAKKAKPNEETSVANTNHP